jgi:hypothetical protein
VLHGESGAGLGIFTAVELQPDEIIGETDVMVPVVDSSYHHQALGPEMAMRDDWWYLDPMAEYLWNGIGMGMHRETAHPTDGYEFVTGNSSRNESRKDSDSMLC